MIGSSPIASGAIASAESGGATPPEWDVLVLIQSALAVHAYQATQLKDYATGVGTDVLGLSDGVEAMPIAVVASLLGVGAGLTPSYEAHVQLSDDLRLAAALTIVHRALLQDAVAVDGVLTPSVLALVQVRDALVLTGAAPTSLEAVALIVDALVFADVLAWRERVTVADALAMGDAITAAYQAYAALVDELLLTATLTSSATLVALLRDDLAVDATGAYSFHASAVLRDAVDFGLRFAIGGEEYIAWSMNLRTRALSKFTNYPFNSFMRIGSAWYGAADTGLYRLGGDDDDGDAINARLRLGLSDLGSRRMKRLPEVFIGAAASGDLLLKVIVPAEADGAREAHVYRCHMRGADSTRTARVKPGRGLRSVYWDFEVENVDGAAFDIESIEFVPLQLDSKIRGNAGGAP